MSPCNYRCVNPIADTRTCLTADQQLYGRLQLTRPFWAELALTTGDIKSIDQPSLLSNGSTPA